ncbi:hypothetical protein [Actinophytocola xanthii]|uniref:hypothetical protein n=1 Tax=Actinophytocola xanthii TaxID=1912961 RepID=UPI0011789841|nr:hypothetical protein [Actinophytocola xanthii]
MTTANVVLASIGIGCMMLLLGIWVWATARKRRRVSAVVEEEAATHPNAVAVTPQPVAEVRRAEDRLGVAAVDLAGADSRWQVVQTSSCVTATRGWPDGTVDTVLLFAAGLGHAAREDPDRGRILWSVSGSLEDVVREALTVPSPDAPDAPRMSGAALPRGEWR